RAFDLRAGLVERPVRHVVVTEGARGILQRDARLGSRERRREGDGRNEQTQSDARYILHSSPENLPTHELAHMLPVMGILCNENMNSISGIGRAGSKNLTAVSG